ncbi:MAG: glycosyltransferase family 2 protein [Pseudorhodobacter sp.]
MDKSKAPLAALTMVHEEDFFLRRWIAYWRRFLPDEHIYVLNHGGNEDVARIAEGCNIIRLPYDKLKKSVNQRRWQILSAHGSALTEFYNWVAVNDVDEFVVLDPAVSDDLTGYLMQVSARRPRPPAITTFALEMVHVPDIEPDPLDPDAPILGRRRCYRLNSNYAKPCLISAITEYKAGGHGANHRQIYLDPHLYNFHLRFIDYDYCMDRFRRSRERRLSGKTDEEKARMTAGGWGWNSVEGTFEALMRRRPIAETVDHPGFRREMVEKSISRPPFTLMGGGRPEGLYSLPRRFDGIF